jgi:2-keto-4-pentenoate hydratase
MTRPDNAAPTLRAAELLRQAAETGVACAPVRELLGPVTAAEAYAVQRLNTEHALARGRRLVGWKIGLTNPVIQRQLGIEQPDFGALFADTEVYDGVEISIAGLIHPKVEAEIAFMLDAPLSAPPVTPAEVVRATAFVLPAIEIVDSRIRDWDIGIVDTIADNASAGRYVIGGVPRRLDQVDVRNMTMTMRDDRGIVSKGTSVECFGSPVNAVAWLATTLATLGQPLRPGHIVLSGALGPMVQVEPGSTYEATFSGLGSVRSVFVALQSTSAGHRTFVHLVKGVSIFREAVDPQPEQETVQQDGRELYQRVQGFIRAVLAAFRRFGDGVSDRGLQCRSAFRPLGAELRIRPDPLTELEVAAGDLTAALVEGLDHRAEAALTPQFRGAHVVLFCEGNEQVELCRIVVEDRTAGQAGLLFQRTHSRSLQAVTREAAARAVKDLLPPRLEVFWTNFGHAATLPKRARALV